jgi:hypothetical protein
MELNLSTLERRLSSAGLSRSTEEELTQSTVELSQLHYRRAMYEPQCEELRLSGGELVQSGMEVSLHICRDVYSES